MATILISTLPVSGHILPALAVAKKLELAGHKVIFALPEDKGTRALLEGRFEFVPTNNDRFLYEPVTLRFSPHLFTEDVAKIEKNMWFVLAIWTCSQIDRLREIVDEHRPALIISDCLHIAPLLVALDRDIPIPTAVLGVTPYRNLLRGAGPVRFGLAPTSSLVLGPVYNLINGLINWRLRTIRMWFTECLSAVSRGKLDDSVLQKISVFGICEALSDAYLQCSSPSLEDDSQRLQENGVEFIGPMNDAHLCPDIRMAPSGTRAKSSNEAKKPTVFITWGTMQLLPPEEFLAVVRKLVWSSGFNVIVAPPGNQRNGVKLELQPERASGLLRVTENSGEFIKSLAGSDVFVSNGGFGGVKNALTLGIPVVCAGNQDDKPDVCGRVNRSGVGIGLAWRNGHRTIIKAIHRVLSKEKFAARAQIIGLELSEWDNKNRLENIVSRLLKRATTRKKFTIIDSVGSR